MNIKLNSNEQIRIETSYTRIDNNFINITSLNDCIGLRITNWSNIRQYTEIRKKDNQIAMFIFKKKRDKKYANLGWWEDAEVVYSCNEVKLEE